MSLRRFAWAAAVLAAAVAPVSAASAAYTFTGITADGKTLTFQYTAAAPISASTVISGTQATCAPACDDIAVFPNSQLKYDLLVFDVKTSGTPSTTVFYLPQGAFAAPGVYTTIENGASTSGTLTVTQPSVPGISAPTWLANGVLGSSYAQTLSSSGGTAPYTYALDSGTLPPGLALGASGSLTGTPTSAGSYTFAVKVTDSVSASSTRSFTVTIGTGLVVATTKLAAGVTNVVYSQTLTPLGGSPSYTWSLVSGTLPNGLSLSAGGVILGSPTSGGVYSFTVRVTDSTSATATQTLSIAVSSVLTVTTAALPNGSALNLYSTSLAAVGGTGAYTWSLASGSMPSGLSLSSAGAITGMPMTSGSYLISLRVTDSAANTATQTLVLNVGSGVTMTSSTLPNGVINNGYSYSFGATGGTSPYTWTVMAGLLPPGLSLSTSGVLSGIPTSIGSYTFQVRVTDSGLATLSSVWTLSLQITSQPTVATSATLPSAQQGTAYSQALVATGGSGSYSWYIAAGSLPPGLTFSTSGAISGTPTSGGVYNFVARVSDSSTGSALQSFTLSVSSALAISTSTLPGASVGVPYTQTLSASGGVTPYTWTLASGTVPPGLSLSTNGILSGTPTTGGTYSFTVRATDSLSSVATQPLSIVVASALAITTSSTLPGGVPSVTYSTTLAAIGGTAPYVWALTSGTLPPGLSLSNGGTISGTPLSLGNYTFGITVTDGASSSVAQAFTLTISNSLIISTSSPLTNGSVGTPYSLAFSAAGGTAPYTWTISGGTVPPGLSLTTAGVLNGTPTTSGSFIFDVRATDAVSATYTKSFTLTISASLSITSPLTLPSGNVGAAYSQTLTATGGATPYIWSLNAGSLPAGLSLSNGGAISGTPTTPGSYSFGVRVTDASSATTTATFSLIIGSGVVISTSSLPNGTVNTAYSQTLVASGGTSPYTWSLFSGSMPPGLALSNAGVIAGTPTTAGSYTFSIRATDSTSATATQSFTLVVNGGITITSTSPLTAGAVNTAYSFTFSAAGGTAPYTWTIASGTLPPGLTLGSLGLLSGTPTMGGTYSIGVRVTDAASASALQTFTLVISSGITITTASPLPDATVGSSYFLTFGASGGTGPYNWSLYSGTLPTGLSLSSSGTLSGTPSVNGTFNFTVRLVDSASTSTSASYALTVSSGSMAARAGVISQIATGGSWKTTLVIVNPSDASTAAVRVNFYAEDGTLMTLPMTVTAGGSSISTAAGAVERTLAPNATMIIETDSSSSATTVGWADVRSASTVSGYAIFRQKHGDNTESEGTSILDSRTASTLLLPFDNLNTYSTGVALVNLASDTALVTAIYRDDTGAEITRDIISVVANGHTSFSIPTRLAALTGRRGVVEFVSNQTSGIVALGLRFNPTLNFTNVPVSLRP
jgi:hypothetical protein